MVDDITPHDDDKFASDLVDIIQHSRIFSDVSRTACETLLPRLERISLLQGSTLFEQGDISDCLYILVDGQLMAQLNTPEGKLKIVGTVEKGETVGELGALSNQPRSLTIRAAVDCRLLKLPRQEFEIFCKEQPNFISRIIDLVISRSQNTLKSMSQNKLYKHIAIIKGNEAAPLQVFLELLKNNFPTDSKYILLDYIADGKILLHRMEQAEEENKTLIFVLDEENARGLEAKFNHIGGVFVVVDGDIPTLLSEFTLKILMRHETPFTTQYELILVHDDDVTKPTGTMEWLEQAKFTLHHHIHISDDLNYQRILRFMMGRANGLVLSGGGQKGWVSVGALKAILERSVPIDAIGGTSVGAVVAACYAKYTSYHKTYDSFKILSYSAHISLSTITWPLISLLTAREPTEALQNEFEDMKIEDMWLPFFAISCNLTTGKEIIHREGILWEKLRASAAIPGMAPPMVMEGELHYDGGLLNNFPVDQMRELLGDEGRIIGVTLSGSAVKTKLYQFPPILPFWAGLIKKLKLGYRDYIVPPFLHTFLDALLAGSSYRERANYLLADLLIHPDLTEQKTLQLNPKNIHTMIQIGYSSTKEQLKESKLFQIK